MISQLKNALEEAIKNEDFERAYIYATNLDYYSQHNYYWEMVNYLCESDKYTDRAIKKLTKGN